MAAQAAHVEALPPSGDRRLGGPGCCSQASEIVNLAIGMWLGGHGQLPQLNSQASANVLCFNAKVRWLIVDLSYVRHRPSLLPIHGSTLYMVAIPASQVFAVAMKHPEAGVLRKHVHIFDLCLHRCVAVIKALVPERWHTHSASTYV